MPPRSDPTISAPSNIGDRGIPPLFKDASGNYQVLTLSADGNLTTGIKAFRSSDSTYQPVRIDKATNGLIIMDYEHHKIHDGSHFFIESVVDLAINNVLDVQFTTPNTTNWTHFAFRLNTESETEWYIYEGATVITPGTAVTPLNNNRNSSATSGNTVKIITNGTVADANADTSVASATTLGHNISGAGKDSGITSRDNEIILKQNTTYCFRAIANAAGYIGFACEWYEHTSVA